MEFLEELKQLQNQTANLYRGRVESNIEKKIRESVFDIIQQLYKNTNSEKFINTTKLMYRDWSQSYSEDIRFGRDEDADKAMIKLCIFEWVLSLPSVQNMRLIVNEGKL